MGVLLFFLGLALLFSPGVAFGVFLIVVGLYLTGE